MTTHAEIVKLIFQQRPDVRVFHMTIHAIAKTCVISIIVVTEYAVLLCMIRMGEGHWEYRLGAVVVVTAHWFVMCKW